MLQYRVNIYNEKNDLLSSDIWYGNSLQDVEFWVKLAAKNIIENSNSKNIFYTIDQVI